MKIVVPCDFSKVVAIAVEYAVRMARQDSVTDIILLHVYDKGTTSSAKLTLDQAKQHVEQEASDFAQRYRVQVRGLVREGSLNDTIPEVAEEKHADFVVMGTHGIKGMQKFLGSKAIKVVADCAVPFLVVQSMPPEEIIFKRMIMPLGARPEEVEKINWAQQFVRTYGTQILLVTEHYNDPSFQRKLGGNVALAKRVFDSSGIKYDLVQAMKGKKLTHEIERLAREYKCDWMMIMITQGLGALSAAFDSTDQDLIANELGLPVVCVNPSMAMRW